MSSCFAYTLPIYSSITCPDKLSSSITCLDSGRIVEVDLYMKVGSVCPSVCTTVSSSINPLPSDRLRCYDRYIHRIIRCQRSLAVKTLNSWPAMSGPHLTREVCVEWAGIGLPMYDIGLQLLGHGLLYTGLHGWACAMTVSKLMRGTNWLSDTSLTATAREVLDCGLWLACAALLRLTSQATSL